MILCLNPDILYILGHHLSLPNSRISQTSIKYTKFCSLLIGLYAFTEIVIFCFIPQNIPVLIGGWFCDMVQGMIISQLAFFLGIINLKYSIINNFIESFNFSKHLYLIEKSNDNDHRKCAQKVLRLMIPDKVPPKG